jgi:hypothetical protein
MTAAEIERFFEGPYQRYMLAPTTLTDADLEELGRVDKDLETRAAARRAGYARPVDASRKRRPLTRREFDAWLDDYVGVQLSVLIARINQLERQIAAQKSVAGGAHWAGTYDAGRVYEEGSLVTKSGPLWLAETTNPMGHPGEGASGWVLIVKAGHYDHRR